MIVKIILQLKVPSHCLYILYRHHDSERVPVRGPLLPGAHPRVQRDRAPGEARGVCSARVPVLLFLLHHPGRADQAPHDAPGVCSAPHDAPGVYGVQSCDRDSVFLSN